LEAVSCRMYIKTSLGLFLHCQHAVLSYSRKEHARDYFRSKNKTIGHELAILELFRTESKLHQAVSYVLEILVPYTGTYNFGLTTGMRPCI